MNREIRTVHFTDPIYPHLLQEISGAPQKFSHIGELPPLNSLCVSIVGTRKATREGSLLARTLGESLAGKGFVIVSGLALGIDAAAHEGALRGGGRTIAVLANGLDSIYPRQHENLAEEIISSGGTIISEYEEGTPALPHQFLERNRIVSGLSIATIVIEAPLRSGSIATARNAIEQGREVYVFPGNVNHPNYKGSHRLIREGARLVTSLDDILADLGESATPLINEGELRTPDDAREQRILEVLRDTGEMLTVDKIVEITILPPQIVNERLTFLLIDGYVEEVNGLFRARA